MIKSYLLINLLTATSLPAQHITQDIVDQKQTDDHIKPIRFNTSAFVLLSKAFTQGRSLIHKPINFNVDVSFRSVIAGTDDLLRASIYDFEGLSPALSSHWKALSSTWSRRIYSYSRNK